MDELIEVAGTLNVAVARPFASSLPIVFVQIGVFLFAVVVSR